MSKLIEIAIVTVGGLLYAAIFLTLGITKWFFALFGALLLFFALFTWCGWHMTHQLSAWHALMHCLEQAAICAAIVAACQFGPFLLFGSDANFFRPDQRFPRR